MAQSGGIAPCVLKLCQAIDQRDCAAIAAQLAPGAHWTIVGRTDRFPFGGTRQREQMLEELAASLAPFSSFSFKIESCAQSGDIAFVEAVAEGIGPNQARYTNRYLMKFTLADGLVAEVLEHYDPFEALAYVEQATGQ